MLSRILKQYWGYDSFRPHQREAMECVMNDRDSLVVLPTGGGKSLCFQAPAVARPGLAVVVSPLISLMKDQVDALTACGVEAARLNSATTPDERREVADAIRDGRLKLLYVAPERLVLPDFMDYLARAAVGFFAIDEAHCISHWGHDFRPEYRELRRLRERFPAAAIHAYTATATKRVRDDIARQLGLRDPATLVGSFFRPNLVYSVESVGSAERTERVKEIVARRPNDSGIVYCISRNNVMKLAGDLRAAGYMARPYHAGLDDETRKANQEAFIREQCDIIVATVAFGMGIDKSNVRYVIHAGMPKSLEHYSQESGRAGRDGLESECVMLHGPNDATMWRKILGDLEGDQRKTAMEQLEKIAAYCRAAGCRHKRLVEHFDQKLGRSNCGACDVCLSGAEPVPDALIVAQKILSCVVRLGESRPSEYVVSVLRGAPAGELAGELADPAHAALSTWGLMRDLPADRVWDWTEQLVDRGYLARAAGERALKVTEAGRAALRGRETPRLLMPPGKTGKKPTKAASVEWDGVERDLFDMLRVLRRGMAEELEIPAFVIFNDATLRELARLRPSTRAGLLAVPGVGERKAEAYGEKFMRVIADYCAAKSIPTE